MLTTVVYLRLVDSLNLALARFDFLLESQCCILCLDYEKMLKNVRHLKFLTLSESLLCVSLVSLYLFNFFHYFLSCVFLGNIE